MSNRFADYIYSVTPKDPPMPLFHTLDAFFFRKVLESENLIPIPCENFDNEYLLYLFYGRPAYRAGFGENAGSLNAFYPICILIKPEHIQVAKRVYPFDSGAFIVGLYSDYLHKDMTIESFLIEIDVPPCEKIPLPEIPARFVSAFYDSNRDYYTGNVRNNINFSPLDFEIQSYYELIRSKSITAHDDRRATVEVQIDLPISLSENSVMAIVAPTIFLEEEEILDAIESWHADVITYDSYHASPSDFTTVIIEKVKDFLSDRGYL